MEARGRLSATRIVKCSWNSLPVKSFTEREDFWTTCVSRRVERKSHSWNTRCTTTMKDGLLLSMQPVITRNSLRNFAEHYKASLGYRRGRKFGLLLRATVPTCSSLLSLFLVSREPF